MKRATGHAVLSASLLGRLSAFDMADFGSHASLLYRELITSASAGLPVSTIILAAAIIDIVQHEQAGPAGYLDRGGVCLCWQYGQSWLASRAAQLFASP